MKNPVEFEPPQKQKEAREIIKAMFDSGKWSLVNYIVYGIFGKKPKNKVVTKSKFSKMDFNTYAYCNVEVIHPNTGRTIIDFIDGKCVLENGEIVG